MAESGSESSPSGFGKVFGQIGKVAGRVNEAVVKAMGIEDEKFKMVPLKDITEPVVAFRVATHLRNTVRERVGIGTKWDNGFTKREAFEALGYLGPVLEDKEYEPADEFPKEYQALGDVLQLLINKRILRVELVPDNVHPTRRIRYWVIDPVKLNALADQAPKAT